MIDFQEVHNTKMREGLTVILALTLVALGVMFILLGFYADSAVFMIIGSIFTVLGGYIFMKSYVKTSAFHGKFFKNEAIPYLESIIDDFKYDKEKGFTEDSLINANITNKYNYFESSNLITGIYRDIAFNYSDVSVIQVSKTKKNKFVVDQYFKGKIFKQEYQKPFKFTLLITKVSLLAKPKGLLKVSIGNITLPDAVNIYTTSEEKLLKNISKEFVSYLETIINESSTTALIISGKTLAVLSYDGVNLFDVHNEQGYNEGLLKTFTDPLDIFVDIYNLINPK
ncbi:MAG: hypothetical protein QM489_00150 [Candidatus Izemoplasma sp.]